MKLRDYQEEAFEAALVSLRKGNNCVICIPTGGGKSAVIAALVDRFRIRQGYTLVLTHSKELVVQNFNTLARYSNTEGVGVYSAGLNKTEVGEFATYGTIQTLYRNLNKLPRNVDAIIVDEVQAVPHKGSEAKMYNTLLNHFPNARRIGLSATPYRLDKGLVYVGEDAHFNDLAIDIKVKELVEAGYLSPLKGVSAAIQLNLEGIHRSNGDFDTKEVDERMTEAWLREVMSTTARLAKGRKAILMFAPTVRVAELASKIANEIGITAEYVHGGDKEREDRLTRWEAGEFTLMANCQILTTGYDRPDIDCILDCAPTESLGKHIQKLGRGTRKAEGKSDCLIIDVAGNLLRLGGISSEADFEEEKPNGERVAGVIRKPAEKKSRATKRANLIDALDPMAGGPKEFEVSVDGVNYVKIGSKSRPGKDIVLVNYSCSADGGYSVDVSDFVMPEYDGWARTKSEAWMNRRGAVLPYSAEQTLYMCYGLPQPRRLKVKRNGKYFNVTEEIF